MHPVHAFYGLFLYILTRGSFSYKFRPHTLHYILDFYYMHFIVRLILLQIVTVLVRFAVANYSV